MAGHVYGRHGVSDGLFKPFRESLAAIPEAEKPDFLFLTGDIVNPYTAEPFDRIDRDLAVLGRPAYVTSGSDDGTYSEKRADKRYAARSIAWAMRKSAFVVCDTERYGGNIDGIDLEVPHKICAAKPRAIFIFVHHLVWVDKRKAVDPTIKSLANSVNAGYAEVGNFDDVILPLLMKSGAQCYIIAGDVGAGSRVVEWHDEVRPGIHVFASGMGEHPHVGTYLLFDVSDEAIRVKCLSLNDDATKIPNGALFKQ